MILSAAAAIAATAAVWCRPPTPTLYPRFRGVASPPLSPEQALSTFRLAEPGLAIRCVASEPLIEAPVAAQFDERGRLWVVEMVTYMPDVQGRGELERRNRVSVLSDSKGTGIFDTRTVFLDDLTLPRAVSPCFDGALVLEPPNLLFCRDTNGDGKADERIVLLSGFGGIESPEHAGNGLIRGMDNWYHLSQHNLEFRIWMENGTPKVQTRPTPSHGQWGIAEDSLGRLYYTPNSNPLLADLYPKHWGALNPHASSAGLGMDIMRDTSCWPIHPTPGVNRGYQEHSLRPDGTLANLTAACGTMILHNSKLLPEFASSAFIGEAAGNLVKRAILKETSTGPRGENAYKGREFLASTDERFRPVNLVETPDGALLVLDMYRGVIQHRVFITPFLKEQAVKRNLETPLNMGRMYRIEPAGSQPLACPDLSRAPFPELVAHLRRDDWAAAQSQRVLVERQDHRASMSLRIRLSDTRPFTARALWTLDGLGDLRASDCREAPESSRHAALELCIQHRSESEFATVFRELAATSHDPALAPIIAAGWAALGDDEKLFAFLAAAPENTAARSAAICFLSGRETALLPAVIASPRSEMLKPLLADLFSCCLRGDPAQRNEALAFVSSLPAEQRAPLLDRLAAVLKPGSRFPKAMELAAEPHAFLALTGDARLPAMFDQFTWPGHALKAPPIRALTDAERALFERGEFLYHTCAACHQADGRGSPGQAPPLAGSSLATGPADRAIKIVLHGLTGKYEVNGQKFEGAMPVPQVGSDEDIASVLTYVRRSFGNTAEPLTAAEVLRVRTKNSSRTRSWSREELDRSPIQ